MDCYQGLSSRAGVGTSLAGEDDNAQASRHAMHIYFAEFYFAGTARNQISNPKRISAPRSENAVCSGWNWNSGLRGKRCRVASIETSFKGTPSRWQQTTSFSYCPTFQHAVPVLRGRLILCVNPRFSLRPLRYPSAISAVRAFSLPLRSSRKPAERLSSMTMNDSRLLMACDTPFRWQTK